MVLKVWNVLLYLLPQLEGNQVAQGIGGEVAEQAEGPVYVLQAAVGVVLRSDAQVLLKAFVPFLRQLADLDRTFQQADLDLQVASSASTRIRDGSTLLMAL